eukprot:ctg_1005.g387
MSATDAERSTAGAATFTSLGVRFGWAVVGRPVDINRTRQRRRTGRQCDRGRSSARIPLRATGGGYRRVRAVLQPSARAVEARRLGAGGHRDGHLPRRLAKRGRRPHRQHAPPGASHVQGLSALPQGERPAIWTVLQNVGAQVNATTWFDHTNYYATLPSDFIEEAIAIEADRMRRALLRPADLESELTVVRNEYDRGENDNFQALDQQLWATAYQAHPYHHPTIGWRDDIENATAASLRQFYDTYYHPNNATLSIIGDFPDTATVLRWVRDHFGAHPPSSHCIESRQRVPQEPTQRGPRRLVLRRSGRESIVGIAFKSPAGLHPDAPALMVLSAALAGGKSSRLYRHIVDPGLATHVAAWDSALRDPGLFCVYAFMMPGADHADMERRLWQQLQEVQRDGIDAEELQRAKSQMNAYLKYSRDGTYGVADGLNEALAMGDWTAYCRNRVSHVRVEDVQQVACRYLQEDSSSTGWFVPLPTADAASTEADAPAEAVDEPAVVSRRALEEASTSMALQQLEAMQAAPTAMPVRRHTPASAARATAAGRAQVASQVAVQPLFGGDLQLLTLPTPVDEVVTVVGSLAGGTDHGDADPFRSLMVANMVGDMLAEGSQRHDKFQLAERLENVGAGLRFSVLRNRLRFQARCLRPDLELVTGAVAEQLTEPRFDATDFENTRQRYVGDLESAKESTGRRAEELFLNAVYPRDHPNYAHSTEELIESLHALRLPQVQAFWERYGLGSEARVIAVGDVEASSVRQLWERHFRGGWRRTQFAAQLSPARTAYERAAVANFAVERSAPPPSAWHTYALPDKPSVEVHIGQTVGISNDHPDYYALAMAVFILGGNFSSRLMQRVRDEQGLTYGIGAAVEGAELGTDGFWRVVGTFGTSQLQRGVQATADEIRRWYDEGVSRAELDAKKATVYGGYQVGLASTRGLASVIADALDDHRPLHWVDEYTERIGALEVEQVNAAMRRWIDPNQLVIAAAGQL